MRLRRLLYALLALLVLAGIGALAAKFYLASRMTPEVASRLQSALGVPVQVGASDIGLTGASELRGVQVFEPPPPKGAAPAHEEPWFRAERVDADVSVLDLLRGAVTPHRVRLRGVLLTLRFDKDDNLLTRLPAAEKPSGGTLPEVDVEDAKLTLIQEGRPPMTVEGIRVALAPSDGGLKATGTVSDPRWGKWDVGGAVAPSFDAATLALNTQRVEVTAEKLKSLPFVSPAVWREVTAEGTTPARLSFTFSADKGASNHYRVELQPTETRVRVSSIDLGADHASGKVLIEDKLVTLADVAGRFANGEMRVGGTLDFRPTPSVLKLDVAVRDVRVDELPRSWDVPKALNGKLTGTAKVRVRLTEPALDTAGSSGEGVVAAASLFGLGTGAARLYLHPGPGRLQFRQEPPKKEATAPAGAPALTTLALPPADPPPGGAPGVGAALGAVSRGMSTATNAVTNAAMTAAGRIRRPDRPPPPGKRPTYFEANLSLKDVDLAEFVRRAKLALPFSVSGKMSFQLNVGFPADTPRDFKTYRFQGDVQFPTLNVAGFAMADVRARARYANGLLVLESLHGQTPVPGGAPGSFDGTARYQVVPAGDLTATLRIDRVLLDAALRRLPDVQQARGTLSGTVRFRAPGERLRDPSAWEAAATLRSDELGAYGVTLRAVSATVTLTRGTATVRDLKGNLEGASLTGNGTLRLAGFYPYDAELSAPGLDLSFVRRFQPDFRPPLSVTGRLDLTANLKGTLGARTVSVSGSARAADLTVESARVNALSFRYEMAPDRIRITDVDAELYGGTVTGSATVPLRPAAGGDVAARVKDVDAKALSRGVPAFPVRLEGRVSGTVNAKLPPTTPDRPRAIAADIELTAPELRLQGIPTERVRGTVTYQGGTGSYRLEGEVAGGTFKVEGPLAPQPAPGAPAPPGPAQQTGNFQLRDVRIGRLVASFFRGRGLGALRGRLDVDLPFRLEGPGRLPTGRGTFMLTDVRWGNDTLTDRVEGRVEAGADGVRVGDVNASLAGGILRLRAGYRPTAGGRNYLDLELYNADVARLVAPFPALAGRVDGTADVNLRLGGARELRGTGRVLLTAGHVFGIEVADWRLPLDFAFVPGDGGQLDVRDSSARVARGRALGRASMTWGYGTRLEGNVRFFDAELRNLFGPESGLRNYANGQLSGTIDFGSDDFRSPQDLNATLTARLSQAQALGMPVLQQTIPFLGLVGGSESTRFQGGDLRGRLARGVFRLERFTLTSPAVQLVVEGNVNLAGLLDLEVTAATSGSFCNSRVLQLLGLRLPALGPLPLTLVVDASAFLANRVVHLRITGTYRNPVVQVVPTALLTEEAVRFFLSRAGLPVGL